MTSLQAALPVFRAHSRHHQPIINYFLPESHTILLQSSKQPLLINQGWSKIMNSLSVHGPCPPETYTLTLTAKQRGKCRARRYCRGTSYTPDTDSVAVLLLGESALLLFNQLALA